MQLRIMKYQHSIVLCQSPMTPCLLLSIFVVVFRTALYAHKSILLVQLVCHPWHNPLVTLAKPVDQRAQYRFLLASAQSREEQAAHFDCWALFVRCLSQTKKQQYVNRAHHNMLLKIEWIIHLISFFWFKALNFDLGFNLKKIFLQYSCGYIFLVDWGWPDLSGNP